VQKRGCHDLNFMIVRNVRSVRERALVVVAKEGLLRNFALFHSGFYKVFEYFVFYIKLVAKCFSFWHHCWGLIICGNYIHAYRKS